MAAARSGGAPVEVLARRTERERTFANPDGSWTSEVSAVPVRVRRPGGAWVPVDTALRRVGDRVEPVAVPGGTRFSAGGSGPAAVVGTGGREVSLGMPWPLPRPELSGSRATYRDVRPGLDLVLTALPEGFSEVLVVRTRAAAADPQVRSLRLRLSAAGLVLRPHAGGFVAQDATGRVEFTSPAPRMWDSAGGPGADGAGPAGSSAEGATPAGRASWPAPGDRSARMAAAVAGDRLTVVADRSMLDDPATVFPVYLDPAVSATRNEWAMISSGYSTQEYYKFSGDEGMGLCDVQTESTCNKDQIKRLAWEFGFPAAARGSHILGATFRAYETHAWDCTADAVQLWLVGAISSATNWSNHASTWSRSLHSVSVARKSGCSLGPGWVDFTATGGAADAAAGNWSTLTLGLRAGSESSMPGGWKRFRNDATLSITYNSEPRVPTSLSAEGAGCGSGTGRPVLPTATPTLRAVVSDPDPETDLKAAFAWQRWTGSTWTALGSATQSGLTSGGTGQYKITSGLEHEGIYRWQVQAQDPWSHNGGSGTDSSDWSGWCEFTVDTVGPQVAPVVSSPVYGTDLGVFYGAVGLTADFTLAANGVPDVAGYRWGWADPPTTYVAAPAPGAALTLPLTPPPPTPADPTSGGLTTLYVVSVDGSGRTSPLSTYIFNVGSATAPVGVWQLGEPAGSTTMADTTTRGTPHPATLSNGTAGVAGRILNGPAKAAPTAVAFNGTSTVASTTGPVLNTATSFTVSAWARLASTTAHRAVLCQDGTRTCGFALEYLAGVGWVLDMYGSDTDGPTVIRAASAAAVAGVWTHLVAVHDAGTRQVRLYVNGTLAGTGTHPGAWNATGPVLIGRARYNGTPNNFFAGDIAEVSVWDRVVSAEELAPSAGTLVARWRLDGDGSDATAYGRDLTAAGAVTWADDRDGAPASAAALNGVDQSLVTAGPVIRTDQSFTVTGWVRSGGGTLPDTALAQDGANVSAFYLGCRTTATPTWSLVTRPLDSTSGTSAVANSGTCTAGTWTHLAAVRDATAGQLRLYVNGALAISVANTYPTWQASGPFTVGRAKWAAALADFWTGDIDDVRVYAGALPAPEITRLAG